jgi:hypothetical protein
LEKTVRLIPPDASVRVSEHIGPHLSQRRLIFPWNSPYRSDFAIFDGYEPFYWRAEKPKDKDVPAAELISPFPLDMLHRREFGLIHHDDEVFIFRRGANFEKGIKQWATAPMVKGQWSMKPSTLNPQLFTLVGHNISARRMRQGAFIDLTFYWKRNGQKMEENTMRLSVTSGSKSWQLKHAPTFGVYPTGRWRPDEVVRDHVFIRLYEAQPGERYKIGIGSVEPPVCEVCIP